ncbi:hypothetical protein Dda_4763 [Drechslerella dactyloides]|uniref:Uncharacterized protein n=1 Tax=Drechslerella dactyloides TaxID=74499 RepID=A0AAD6IYB0_DREDA|nr:hypothetical protein Dda_4763 [Drechslerella dactyloides]
MVTTRSVTIYIPAAAGVDSSRLYLETQIPAEGKTHTEYPKPPNMMDLSEKDIKSILPQDESFTPPRILILCPDKALAPYAASEPWFIFKEAGCVIEFATENGDVPKADQRMLERSRFRDLIGATADDVERFFAMAGSDEYLNPRAWSAPDFSLLPYDAVYLTSGFDTRLRQFVESESLHRLLAAYFPLSKRKAFVKRSATISDKLKRRSMAAPEDPILPTVITEKHKDELDQLEGPRKVVAAMGKGVLALSMSMVVDNLTPEERRSVDQECTDRIETFEAQRKKEEEEKDLARRSTSNPIAKLKINSPSLKRSATTGSYFKPTKTNADGKKPAEAPKDCPAAPTLRSVIYDVETTTVPAWLENLGTTVGAIHGFKNMFKTYSKSTQAQVVKSLGNPTLYHAGPPNRKPFVHSARTHHYVSARYPGEGKLTSLHVLEEIAIARREWGKSIAGQ